MEDAVPETMEGALLAIADKIDSIVGMFSLGLQPTGSKDPFALRRQANGIVRILAEHKLNVRLTRLFRMARAVYENRQLRTTGALTGYEESLAAFFRERLEFYLRESRDNKVTFHFFSVTISEKSAIVEKSRRIPANSATRLARNFSSCAMTITLSKNVSSAGRSLAISARAAT